MSDSMVHLRRKISTAGDLQSVVRTMKAMAASSVTQYEQSVLALHDYYHTIELGLSACFRKEIANASVRPIPAHAQSLNTHAIVFGSDQGLVGQFNDVIADHAIKTLSTLPGKTTVWAVGERVQTRLADSGMEPKELFHVPISVKAIAATVGQIQIKIFGDRIEDRSTSVYVFHNRPKPGALFDPVDHRLLPLDRQWEQSLTKIPWPTRVLPEVLGSSTMSLQSLIHEYLFISLFRACAESLASENASRLAAMQRADKNIDELLETLHTAFHRQRQGSIDEELFDVVAGFESLSNNSLS